MNKVGIRLIGIVAVSKNYVIGKNGKLPWRLPKDLAFFKRRTEGHIVLMGRKTFESIGKPLPNRLNVVLSKTGEINTGDYVRVVSDVDKFFNSIVASQSKDEQLDVYVLGGKSVYDHLSPYITQWIVTHVDAVVEGDTILTPYWLEEGWELDRESYEPADEQNKYDMHFCIYTKQS